MRGAGHRHPVIGPAPTLQEPPLNTVQEHNLHTPREAAFTHLDPDTRAALLQRQVIDLKNELTHWQARAVHAEDALARARGAS